MSNQNTKKSPEFKCAPFNWAGELEMDNFSCLNSSVSVFYFYFVTKNIVNYGVHTLTVEPPSSPIRTSTLLVGPPLLRTSVPTLWMTPNRNTKLWKLSSNRHYNDSL